MSDVGSRMQPPAKPRKRKAATLRDDDWEPHREHILELHASGMSLEEVKRVMEADFQFFPEIRQYKSQFKKWGLGRNVTAREMKAIVRKRQQRKILEPGRPDLVFAVRATEVNPEKIERWMTRHNVHESELYAPSPAASTPSAIDYHTPRGPSTPGASSNQAIPPVMSHDLQRELCSFIDSISRLLRKGSFPLTRRTDDSFVWVLWVRFFSDHYKYSHALEVFEFCSQLTGCYLEGMTNGTSQQPHDIQPHSYNVFFIPSLLELGLSDYLLEAVVRCWLTIGVDMEHRCSSGSTPFLDACRNGSSRYVSLLVKYGADVHVVDNDGQGALTWAQRRLENSTHGYRLDETQAIIKILEAEANDTHDRRKLPYFEDDHRARLGRVESMHRTIEGLQRYISVSLSRL